MTKMHNIEQKKHFTNNNFLRNRKNRKGKYLRFVSLLLSQLRYRRTCYAPQNDRLNFSFVKYIHVVGEKMARKG